MKRAGFYYDGYNVYHAIANLGRNHLKWVSYRSLSEKLLAKGEEVAFVKVFTALATHLPASAARHDIYNQALALEGVSTILGQFKVCKRYCKSCRSTYVAYEEKESDVNLALHILNDCRMGLVDSVYLITTDSDLAPVAKMVQRSFANVEVVTVRTPDRNHSKALLNFSHRKGTVDESMVENSLLPEHIFDSTGRLVCSRPKEYAPPSSIP